MIVFLIRAGETRLLLFVRFEIGFENWYERLPPSLGEIFYAPIRRRVRPRDLRGGNHGRE